MANLFAQTSEVMEQISFGMYPLRDVTFKYLLLRDPLFTRTGVLGKNAIHFDSKATRK